MIAPFESMLPTTLGFPFGLAPRISFALFSIAALGWAQGYTFTKIADNAPSSEFIVALAAAIGPDGTVVFGGLRRDGDNGGNGVYTFKDGVIKRLPDIAGIRQISPAVSINSAGAIAASLHLNDLSGGVFTLAGGQLAPAYPVAFPYVGDPIPQINENGDIAFSIGTPLSSKVVFVARSGVTTTIADAAGNFSGVPYILHSDVNNAGQVVFAAGGNAARGGLFIWSNGTLARVVPESFHGAGFVFDMDGPAINDSGVVMFMARDDSLILGLHVYSPGGQVQTVARPGNFLNGTPFREVTRPSINNRNHLAFVARHNSANPQDYGVYALRNGTWAKVIAVGDSMFGSTVNSIIMPRGKFLDQSDRIVFTYGLTNGTGGIALASPGASGGGLRPVLAANSVLNAASFVLNGQAGHAVSPGAIVSVFGSQFVEQLAVSTGSPLPTSLAGLSVTFNGTPAPLFFAAPGQVNAQVPYSVTGATAEVKVVTAGGESSVQTVQLTPTSPALFTASQQGGGQAITVHASSGALAAPVGFAAGSRPARAGDTLVLYANGLGAVDPPVAAGSNSCNPNGRCLADYSNLVLRRVVAPPTITIGGVAVPAANIVFAGLAPEFVGLYQVNLTVPPGLPSGNAVPIVIRQGGNTSRADVTIAVE